MNEPYVAQFCWYNSSGYALAAIVTHVSGTPESRLVELYVFAGGGSGPGCGDNFRVSCSWVTGTIEHGEAGPVGSMFTSITEPPNPGYCLYRSNEYAWVEEECWCSEGYQCDPASLPQLPHPDYPNGETIMISCVPIPSEE